MGLNWIVDWILRFLQDSYKSGFSFENTRTFLVVLILAAILFYRKGVWEWLKSTHRKVRQVDELQKVEQEIKELKFRIVSQLSHLEGQDEEFKSRVDTIIEQIKSLFSADKNDQLNEGDLTNGIRSLETIYGESIEDIKKMVNSISDDLDEAERIFTTKKQWARNKGGSIYRKRRERDRNQDFNER